MTANPAAPTPASWRFLHSLNPLSKLAAPIIAIVLVLFTRSVWIPASLIVLAYLLLLIGARMTRALTLVLFVIMPLGIVLVAAGLSVWTDPTTLDDPGIPVLSVGSWTLLSGAVESGLSASLRLGAMFTLTFLGGATTTGPDLVRSAVQHLKLPYRIGYTALAAYRFIPRFQHELGIIRAAHRVRGRHDGGGPFAAIARGWGYILPLMAGAIRHAERVALAMDSRAFGAHTTRTERYDIPWRTRDAVFLVAFVVVSLVPFIIFGF